jgi:hypothetical protein
MYFDVVDASYVADYTIKLVFADGSEGAADLSDYPNEDTVFRCFQDLEYFKNFRVEFDTVVWGDGDIDIAPETLYSRATGRVISYRVPGARV